MTTAVTKESLAARIADLESGARSLKEDYTLAAYKMLLATMEAEPVYQVEGTVKKDENGAVTRLEWVDVSLSEATRANDDFGLLVRTLYKLPPAPVELANIALPHSWFDGEGVEVMSADEVKRACRAATIAAVPQVVPGKWIPVREQKPENKPGSYEYLVFETLNNRVNHDYWNVPSEVDNAFTPFWNHYGENVTHWMPLPSAPQEVKGG